MFKIIKVVVSDSRRYYKGDVRYHTYIKGEKLEMEQNFIKHGDDIVTIIGNVRCTNGDCPYINYEGRCTGDIENCEYRQQRNDAFINYTFDGI